MESLTFTTGHNFLIRYFHIHYNQLNQFNIDSVTESFVDNEYFLLGSVILSNCLMDYFSLKFKYSQLFAAIFYQTLKKGNRRL